MPHPHWFEAGYISFSIGTALTIRNILADTTLDEHTLIPVGAFLACAVFLITATYKLTNYSAKIKRDSEKAFQEASAAKMKARQARFNSKRALRKLGLEEIEISDDSSHEDEDD